jgi:hypothetical protein
MGRMEGRLEKPEQDQGTDVPRPVLIRILNKQSRESHPIGQFDTCEEGVMLPDCTEKVREEIVVKMKIKCRHCLRDTPKDEWESAEIRERAKKGSKDEIGMRRWSVTVDE